VAYPYSVEGQRVSFCAWKEWPRSIVYYARVSGKGDFAAEPAVIQSQRAPESMAITGALEVEIE
jgi:hypothetical protein